MTEHFNQVVKNLNSIGHRYDLSNAFNDLLTISICSFHRTNIQSRLQEKEQANEELYFNTIKRYDKDNLKLLGETLGLLQLNVLKAPYSDPLGEYFMQYITRGQNGQYFTPEHICEFMAQIHGERNTVFKKNVLDPASGSGRMLLSFAKLNPDNYFYAADNSNICAKMACLNFFLNGLRGEVAWMNSLTMEWYGGWQINQGGLGILPIEKEQSKIFNTPFLKRQNEVKSSISQLELF